MKNALQRTQIYLPKDLREEIDRERRLRGESLAQYLRVAAEERLRKEKKLKLALKELAEQVIGAVDPQKSAWAGVDIEKWQHELRKEDDQHRFGK